MSIATLVKPLHCFVDLPYSSGLNIVLVVKQHESSGPAQTTQSQQQRQRHILHTLGDFGHFPNFRIQTLSIICHEEQQRFSLPMTDDHVEASQRQTKDRSGKGDQSGPA